MGQLGGERRERGTGTVYFLYEQGNAQRGKDTETVGARTEGEREEDSLSMSKDLRRELSSPIAHE